jgi:hypothetical protein
MGMRGDGMSLGSLKRPDARPAANDGFDMDVDVRAHVKPIDDGLQVGSRAGCQDRYSQ